jgi:short subunit dehydrogenase-like uncharacterized protein
MSRRYDIVVFGATGFTGALTAEYLADHAPPGTRWALAGRNGAKLEALRARLGARNAACAELPLLHADAAEQHSMRALAASTRVAVSTVGPFTTHGEPLVAACARAGTDYVDITGESEFLDTMYLRHHEHARRTGSRLVHCCGFESIPYDLGAYFTVRHLPADVPIRIEASLRLGLGGMRRAARNFSGGTWRSGLVMLSRPRQRRRAAAARRRLEADSARRVRALRTIPHRQRSSGSWLLPAAGIDAQIVARSAASLDCYGPDFTYSQGLCVDRLSTAATMVSTVAAVFLLAQIPPARQILLRRIGSGTGPNAAARESRWFNIRFTGEGGGERVVTELSGGDPGYGESSKMVAESALCLAYDELAPRAGQLTPALAMGDALIARLRRSGISFDVLQSMKISAAEGSDKVAPIV